MFREHRVHQLSSKSVQSGDFDTWTLNPKPLNRVVEVTLSVVLYQGPAGQLEVWGWTCGAFVESVGTFAPLAI